MIIRLIRPLSVNPDDPIYAWPAFYLVIDKGQRYHVRITRNGLLHSCDVVVWANVKGRRVTRRHPCKNPKRDYLYRAVEAWIENGGRA